MFTDLANYYQDKSVLVTGGASFIGSHLVHELIKFGSRVTVIDDLSSGFLLNINQVKEKIDEEWAEFEEAKANNDKLEMEKEFGDILFSMINYARFMNIDPEAALEKTNKKFITRFNKLETTALAQTASLTDLTLEELDHIWNQVKQGE